MIQGRKSAPFQPVGILRMDLGIVVADRLLTMSSRGDHDHPPAVSIHLFALDPCDDQTDMNNGRHRVFVNHFHGRSVRLLSPTEIAVPRS